MGYTILMSKSNLAGKGTNTYLYHTPYGCPWSEDPIFDMYPFWLNGLPLATASYDENGNLIKMIKNTYYTDMTEHGQYLATQCCNLKLVYVVWKQFM